MATGATGLIYSLNQGSFQSSNIFDSLPAATYTITAKSSTSCTESRSFTVGEINVCEASTIVITTVTRTQTECIQPPDGSLTVQASGSSGLVYSIDGIHFQTSSTFSNLTAGTKIITVKDGNDCRKTQSVIIGVTPAGPLFTTVKALIQANCETCHTSAMPNGINLAIDCNIIGAQQKIKERAVEGHPSVMPPTGLLPAEQRQKIISWITAGGKYSD